jgi:hypothetical protein
LSYNINNYSTI